MMPPRRGEMTRAETPRRAPYRLRRADARVRGARARLSPRARVGPLVAAVLFLGLTGCEPPDRPPALTGGLPRAAVQYLQPDRVSTFHLDDGVIYRSVRSGAHPWSLHLLEVDLGRCDLGFRVVRAEEGEGRIPVTEMARRSEPGVIAAV